MSAQSDPLAVVIEQLNQERVVLGGLTADVIFQEVPSYAPVPRGAVVGSVTRNIARAIETLQTQQAPRSKEGAEAHATTLERARSGVPIEDIIRAYRLSLRAIHDRFLALAKSSGMSAEEILACSNLLWDVGDWFVSMAAVSFRMYAIQESAFEAVHRTERLRELLSGALDRERCWTCSTAIGLDPAVHYAVFCIATTTAPDRVDAAVLATTNAGVVAAEISGYWVGVVENCDDLMRFPFPIAHGPRRPIEQLYESARIARQITPLIVDSRPGLYSLSNVAWRLAARADPTVWAALRERYIEPALALGEFGELILATLRAYLQENQSVANAARREAVHPNTVRYRLTKYEHLVSSKLNTTRTLVELALALEIDLGADR